MTVVVASSSALCSVTASAALMEKDPLLQWIVNLASPLQCKIVQKKGAEKLSLRLSHDDTTTSSAIVLHERNAILRSLCGGALHHALDHAPYYLMGGHSTVAAASKRSALALAAIASWQSGAASMRNASSKQQQDQDQQLQVLLQQLNEHLSSRSFVVNSCTCTLADLDLFVSLLSTFQNRCMQYQDGLVHVQRWWRQCHAVWMEHNVGHVQLPASAAVDSPIEPCVVPVFFYGTEEFVLPPEKQSTKMEKSDKSSGTKTTTTPLADAKGEDETNQQMGDDNVTDSSKQAAANQKKRAKKAAKAAAATPPPATTTRELDISALDIRVGKMIKVWHHEEADKLFCELIDVGESEPRKIASGLRPFYQTQDLQDKTVLVLCNLKQRNLVGFPSHGMVLCASNDDHTRVELAVPPPDAAIGERVVFEGIHHHHHDGEEDECPPEPENKVAKKKMFEKLAPDLKTNEEGMVVWKGHLATTSAGPVRALNGMPNAQVS